MTGAKTILTVVGALVGGTILTLMITAGGFVLAIGTGRSLVIPGLVSITAGSGSELASATLAGSTVVIWAAGSGAVLAAATLLTRARRTRRRHARPR
jgi:hypothetical protein